MDHTKYDFTRPDTAERTGWEIDKRHIEYLHQLALASPPYSVLCEIGSLRGSSTSAFVDAMRTRQDLALNIYETDVTPELLRLINDAGPDVKRRTKIYSQASYNSPQGILSPGGKGATLVFIDGNHKWPALVDLGLCLVRGCSVICMHDTQKYNAYAWKTCFGSILASELLRKSPERVYWEDKEKREGERTHRGFLVSYPRGENWPWLALQ